MTSPACLPRSPARSPRNGAGERTVVGRPQRGTGAAEPAAGTQPPVTSSQRAGHDRLGPASPPAIHSIYLVWSTIMSVTNRSPQSRPHSAPAYYLARPATWWLTAFYQRADQRLTHHAAAGPAGAD